MLCFDTLDDGLVRVDNLSAQGTKANRRIRPTVIEVGTTNLLRAHAGGAPNDGLNEDKPSRPWIPSVTASLARRWERGKLSPNLNPPKGLPGDR